MLNNIPHTSIPRVVLIPILLLICSVYFMRSTYDTTPKPFRSPAPQHVNVTDDIRRFNKSIKSFWKEVAPALQNTKPRCQPIRVLGTSNKELSSRFHPLNIEHQRPRRLENITSTKETALFRGHYLARKSAQHLAPRLPSVKDRTGIVTTANGEDIPAFLVALRMLRRTGCKLPMEVYLKDWSQYDYHICKVVFSSLHASCVVLEDLYITNTTHIKNSNYAERKALSIFFSTFQHVLYLDIGAFPAYDPTVLFSEPPYTTHGLITWPDFTFIPASEHFYHIAGIPTELLTFRASTAGGHIMINKALHRETLLMILYYTFHGPDYFFPLLCQSTSPECFSEVFAAAAQVVRLPWYHVRTPPTPLGRWLNGTYRTIGLASADPGLDYEYLPPFPSHLHPDPHWLKQDLAHPDPLTETKMNITRHEPPRPRPVFLHQRTLSLNPATILSNKSAVVYETDGTPHRMWGMKDDVMRLAGYDVERRLWDVIAHEACREDWGSEMCRVVGEWVREVCGWMDSIDRPW